MKKLFHQFSYNDAYQWFEVSGVKLTTQEDGCVFPRSQDAMEIVNNLLWQLRKSGVTILTEARAEEIKPDGDGYTIVTNRSEIKADKIVVTTGGLSRGSGYHLLEHLNVEIVPSLPSLFSFCLSDEKIKALMGTVVKDVVVFLPGTKLKAQGALLITHWGISGPAVLKLSSYAVRVLAEKNYIADVSIRWLTDDQQEIMSMLSEMADDHRDKKITSVYPAAFNSRLWTHIVNRSSISPEIRWKDVREKDLHKLLNTLTNDTYQMTGKNRFKEEFVTSGGVSLKSLHHTTLEAKNHKGLYFAGEVTDVDAITGGFNLQAAWTMGCVAARAVCGG